MPITGLRTGLSIIGLKWCASLSCSLLILSSAAQAQHFEGEPHWVYSDTVEHEESIPHWDLSLLAKDEADSLANDDQIQAVAAPDQTRNDAGGREDVLPSLPLVETKPAPQVIVIHGADNEYMAGGQGANFAAAAWQAQIYSPSPVSAYTPQERSGRQDWELSHRCGGTVIAANWLLTAAHCVRPAALDAGRRIRLGARNIATDRGTIFAIDKVVRHPGYGNSFKANDIALVKFSPMIRGAETHSVVKPIPSLDTGMQLSDRDTVVAMGWGKTVNVARDQANALLLKASLKVVDPSICNRFWGALNADKVLCASAPGKSTCSGDSGGPVILGQGRPVLVGVIAGGNDRCNGDARVPGVYTRVAGYKNWMNCVMKNGDSSVCRAVKD